MANRRSRDDVFEMVILKDGKLDKIGESAIKKVTRSEGDIPETVGFNEGGGKAQQADKWRDAVHHEANSRRVNGSVLCRQQEEEVDYREATSFANITSNTRPQESFFTKSKISVSILIVVILLVGLLVIILSLVAIVDTTKLRQTAVESTSLQEKLSTINTMMEELRLHVNATMVELSDQLVSINNSLNEQIKHIKMENIEQIAEVNRRAANVTVAIGILEESLSTQEESVTSQIVLIESSLNMLRNNISTPVDIFKNCITHEESRTEELLNITSPDGVISLRSPPLDSLNNSTNFSLNIVCLVSVTSSSLNEVDNDSARFSKSSSLVSLPDDRLACSCTVELLVFDEEDSFNVTCSVQTTNCLREQQLFHTIT